MTVDVAWTSPERPAGCPAEPPVTWLPTGDVPPAGPPPSSSCGWTGIRDYDSGALGRTWYWKANAATLDFAATWPGQWVVDHPDGNSDDLAPVGRRAAPG